MRKITHFCVKDLTTMFVLATVKGGLHHVGSYVKILDADGSSHEVEVFTKEILADCEPPGGTAHARRCTSSLKPR